MSAEESAVVGVALIALAIALIAWALRSQTAWRRGEGLPRATAFRVQPWAPGQKRIFAALLLILLGITLTAPFVTSL